MTGWDKKGVSRVQLTKAKKCWLIGLLGVMVLLAVAGRLALANARLASA